MRMEGLSMVEVYFLGIFKVNGRYWFVFRKDFLWVIVEGGMGCFRGSEFFIIRGV